MSANEGIKTVTGGDGAMSSGLSPIMVAAHELKAPLALMRQLAIELSDEQTPASLTREIAGQMRVVSEQALRLTSNLTKSQQLQTELFPSEPVNVNELCKQLRYELAPLYTVNERQLVFRSNTRLPLATANHDLLRRIITCFMDNALHYSDEKGVVELHAQLLKERAVVRISVRDHGPALPVNVWANIKQTALAPVAVHSRPESSGLGLHIAHQFAELIHGSIGAIRHRDGASFYIEVPLSRQLSLL